MPWYLVQADARQRQAILDRKIHAVDIQIEQPIAVTGVSFPGENLDEVLRIMGSRREDMTSHSTNVPNVALLLDKSARNASGSVTCNGSNLEHWALFKECLQKYADILKMPIHVENPHEKPRPPSEDNDRLTIYFWSCCDVDQRPTRRFEKVHSITLDGGQVDLGYIPTGRGRVISDPGGCQVAELVGKTLYVFFDLPHTRNSRSAVTIMDYIMRDCVTLLRMPPEMPPEERKLKIREAYVHECQYRISADLARVRKENEIAKEAVSINQERLVEAIRLEDETARRLAQLSEKEGLDEYGAEFDKLCGMAGVVEVGVSEGQVSVLTDTVSIKYDNRMYSIGRFKIVIFTRDGRVRVSNLDRKIDGLIDHPHIREGECCLGNLKVGITKLIGEYQYAVVTQILLQYLHTYTRGDAYRRIDHWPSTKGD